MTPRATAALAVLRAVGTVVSLAAIAGGWYLISLDQQQQEALVKRHEALMQRHMESRK